MISIYTDGFWMKLKSHQEQPNVSFLYSFLLILDDTFVYSTSSSLNQLIPKDNIFVPTFKISSNDQNFDGKIDSFDFKITSLPKFSSVKLVMFFRYELSEVVSLSMDSSCFYQSSSGVDGSSSLNIFSDLKMESRRSLRASNVYDTKLSLNKTTSWISLFNEYYSRDIRTTTFQNEYIWRRLDDNNRIEGKLYIGNQLFHYIPTPWEIIKWVWIQWYSFFILVYLILSPLMGNFAKANIVPEDERMNDGKEKFRPKTF